MGRLAKAILGVPAAEIDFVRRGFRGLDGPARRRLEEEVCGTFVIGYAAALEEDRPEALAARLDGLPLERQGFGYEAAAMALSLRDFFAPWRRPGRLEAFLAGPGVRHRYLVHVGAGWVLARTPQPVAGLLRRLDPLICWLALDGYGFHQGFFHPARSVERRQVPAKVAGYARRVFDQGLGRSLWFVEGAVPERVAATIAAFAESRRGDLWSGTAIAAAYAGATDDDGLERLRTACGPHLPAVAQGAAFAAFARRTADLPDEHTDAACRVLCGRSAAAAAEVVGEAAAELPGDGEQPAYEVWRRRIRGRLAPAAGGAAAPVAGAGQRAAG
jgi:enediyne biosynthesis protein E3